MNIRLVRSTLAAPVDILVPLLSDQYSNLEHLLNLTQESGVARNPRTWSKDCGCQLNVPFLKKQSANPYPTDLS